MLYSLNYWQCKLGDWFLYNEKVFRECFKEVLFRISNFLKYFVLNHGRICLVMVIFLKGFLFVEFSIRNSSHIRKIRDPGRNSWICKRKHESLTFLVWIFSIVLKASLEGKWMARDKLLRKISNFCLEVFKFSKRLLYYFFEIRNLLKMIICLTFSFPGD